MKRKPIVRPVRLLAIVAVLFALASAVQSQTDSKPAAEKPLTEETAAPSPPTEQAPAPTPLPVRSGGVSAWFARGGVFMWPILVCGLAALIFILERAYTLVKARANARALMTDVLNAVRREGIGAGERICEQTRGPIAAIVHSGLRQANKGPEAVEKAIETAGAVEMSFLERGLIWLATISTVAPLLGFLGTVSGMISVLDAIAAADSAGARLVAGGIAEALIPTQAGLLVAIPASIAHNFFLSMIDRFVVEMEESSSELVNTITDMRAAPIASRPQTGY